MRYNYVDYHKVTLDKNTKFHIKKELGVIKTNLLRVLRPSSTYAPDWDNKRDVVAYLKGLEKKIQDLIFYTNLNQE